MKKCLYFLICLALLYAKSFSQTSSQKISSYLDYPGLQTIVEYFLINYQPEDYQNDNFYQFRFIRNPKAWTVISESFAGDKVQEDFSIKLWDRKSGFLKMDSALNSAGEINNPEYLNKILSNSARYNYIIHPFYGYIGWDKDVVRFYKNTKLQDLTQNEIYGIGRAYSSLATNILWSHAEYSDPESVRGLKANKSDLRRYLKYAYKSIDYFRLLNKDYQTIVGLSDIKTANEIIAKWYELQLFGYSKTASDFLKRLQMGEEDILDPFWSGAASYILQNLESNAIIFTNGDNDTYPLIWSQAIGNIRKDVLVINLSLLNDPLYFVLISKGFLNAAPLITGLSDDEWIRLNEKHTEVANNTSLATISFSDQLVSISSQLGDSERKNIDLDFGYYKIPFMTKEFKNDTLAYLSATKRYVTLNQLAFQTILNFHFPERPVYFTKSMNPDFSEMFSQESLLDEGFVIHLTTEANKHPEFNYTYYDREKIQAILKSKPLSFPDKRYFARNSFYQLVLELESRDISEDYRTNGSRLQVERIMDFLEKYPPQEAGLSLHYYNMIYTLYYIEGEKELAEMFLKAFLVELEFQIRSTDLTDEDPNDYNHLRYLNFIIDSVVRSEIDPDIPGFFDDLQSYQRSIQNKLRQMPEIKIR